MIVFSVYIITTDGRLIISEIFQKVDGLPSEFILSGLLTSFKAIAKELTRSYPETLVMGDISYHFDNYEDYFIVVVTDEKDKPVELTFAIGMKFTAEYATKITNWTGDLSIFRPFKTTLLECVNKYSLIDFMSNLDPNNRLDVGELMFLPAELKDIAKILIQEEEIGLFELHKRLNENVEEYSYHEVISKIKDLQKEGYIGQKIVDSSIIYFI